MKLQKTVMKNFYSTSYNPLGFSGFAAACPISLGRLWHFFYLFGELWIIVNPLRCEARIIGAMHLFKATARLVVEAGAPVIFFIELEKGSFSANPKLLCSELVICAKSGLNNYSITTLLI
jgi:hypothetical protein